MAWTPEEEAQLRDLMAQGASVRAIAEAIGKSKSRVSYHARQLGLTFPREQVEAAVDAARTHAKARRALLSARFMDEVEYALDRIHEPYTLPLKDGSTVTLDLPDAGAHRNFMTSAGIAMDKHLAIERVDTDGGQEQAKAVLDRLVEAGVPTIAADDQAHEVDDDDD